VARALPAATGRLLRLLLPFSVRGIVLALIATGLLAEGILRADLPALFWGSSFILYALYALVVGHIFRVHLLRRARRVQEMVSVVLPPAGLFPGEKAEARVETRLPRRFPPGLTVHVSLPLAWHGRRNDLPSTRMAPGTSTRTVGLRAARRGAYHSTEAIVECRDVLGFTVGRLAVSLREAFIVYPALRDPGDASRFMEQADEAAVESPRRRRSEELLEARKYYPGDDVRRLNWKVFAHLNELFIRLGEEVPPPEARLLFVLDTTTNPLVPRAVAAEYLDSLVSCCVSVMDAVMAGRTEVLLSQPGQRDCRTFASRAALLSHAADAAWTDAPWAPELPHRALHVAVFTSPGSPGLAPIMTAVRARGWGASLFVKAPDAPAPRPGFRPADLVLVPREPRAARASRPAPRQARALADAVARDLANHRGGKVTHAVEV
jgi:uncharacterized protein (DUF58 family)